MDLDGTLVLDPMHQTNMEMFVLKATNSCRSVSGSFSNRDLVSYRGWLIRMQLWHCNQLNFFFFLPDSIFLSINAA